MATLYKGYYLVIDYTLIKLYQCLRIIIYINLMMGNCSRTFGRTDTDSAAATNTGNHTTHTRKSGNNDEIQAKYNTK